MINRREFIKGSSLAALGALAPRNVAAVPGGTDFLWATYASLTPNGGAAKVRASATGFSEAVWRKFTADAAASGANAVLMDLNDGIVYPSHPELAIDGSWSVAKAKEELARLRDLGIRPLPCLNFSAAHDNWLDEYGLMLSTKTYLRVVADLIRDVCDIFDGPTLFHIGMDEETYDLQLAYRTAIVRSWEDQWWDDLLYMAAECERNGARAWMWSDFGWRHYDCFFKRMPKSIMQSNWYYGRDFPYDPDFDSASADLKNPVHSAKLRAKFYVDLGKAGYDQIPCGSNWLERNDSWEVNFARTVAFCEKHVPEDRLKGFLMAPWRSISPESEAKLLESNRLLKAARGGSARNA